MYSFFIDRRDERKFLKMIFFSLLIKRGTSYKYTYIIREQIAKWIKGKNFHVKQERIPLRYNEIIIFRTKQSLHHRVNLCNFRIINCFYLAYI